MARRYATMSRYLPIIASDSVQKPVGVQLSDTVYEQDRHVRSVEFVMSFAVSWSY